MAQAQLALALALICAGSDPLVKNESCRDPLIAPYLCDEAARLFDVARSCEKAQAVCLAQKSGLEEKLSVRTPTVAAALTPPIVEEVVPLWVWPVGALVAVGSFIGGVIFGLNAR